MWTDPCGGGTVIGDGSRAEDAAPELAGAPEPQRTGLAIRREPGHAHTTMFTIFGALMISLRTV